jgi:hypothetical protein
MRKNRLSLSFCILLVLHSTGANASFYSTLNNTRYNYEDLLSDFDLVILTSKDCSACKNLQSEIQKCPLPHNFRVAWVGSQASKYQFRKGNFAKIKTSEKTIRKLTQVTPKTILKGHAFKDGVFDCKELEKAI